MARLPQPGGDSGNWGAILNDYLSQAHATDGSLKPASVAKSQLDSSVQGSLDSADAVVQKVAARFVSAADYGALPSASAATNTTAFANAIAAAKSANVELFIPQGTYQHNGIVLPNGILAIRGAGRARTVLRNVHGSNTSLRLHGVAGGPYAPRIEVSDLTIEASAKNSGQVAISVQLASHFSIDRIYISGHGIGVRHEASWNGVYDQVVVTACDTGWLFPTTAYTPSSPMTFRNCSAITNTVGVQVDAGLEATTWTGGDWIQNDTGINFVGADSRSVTFTGINFERNIGDDILVGDGTNGPTGVSFIGCRFLRVTPGTRSVRYQRGQGLMFMSCTWNTYDLGIRQDSASGTLSLVAPSFTNVTQSIDSNGVNASATPLFVSTPNFPLRLTTNAQSTVRQVQASQGVATAQFSGAGKVTVTDGDFTIAPPNGMIALVTNTTDNTTRMACRVGGVWKVTATLT